MKKMVSSLLASLLVLAIAAGLVACGGDPAENSTSTATTATTTTTTTEEDVAVVEPVTTETQSDTLPTGTSTVPTAVITLPNGSTVVTTAATRVVTTIAATAAPVGALTPPANLNTLSKAEQLAYFNKVANNVRVAKPGFKRDNLEKIDEIKLSGAASIANGIVASVKDEAMPGEWEYETIKKGSKNGGKFFSDNTNASDLKVSDITSITSTKSGTGWKITVKLIQEKNPAKGGKSAHSRVACIATRDEVLKTITDISDLITASENDCVLTYHDGYATLTVNAKGQVTSSECGFQVGAVANNVKISFITTNVTAPQSTVVKCHDFVY
ncbi:MAG: hypothetical protein LBQ33_05635 [Oscillospiraceae bacterium]|nr:hypothetical protein [Oscillospiraceae bacterium]